MNKKRILHILFISIFVSILFIYAYRDFLSVGMLSYGDCAPFPVTANQAIEAYASAWQPLSRGVTLPSGILTTALESFTILFCGGNSVVAQKIFYFASLPLAFIAMYFFLRKLNVSTSASLVASFAYSINPVTIGNFGGGVHTYFYVLFFSPLLAIVLIDIGNGKNLLRNTIIVSMLLALTISFGTLTSLFYFIPLAVYAILNPLFKKNDLLTRASLFRIKIKSSLIITGTLLASLILALLLILPYSIFAFSLGSQYLPGQVPAAGVLNSLVETVRSTYASSNLLNILKFGSSSLSSLGYLSSSPWTFLGFIYPILAYASLLFQDHKNTAIKVILALYSFVPITLIWLANLGPGLQIYRLFPMLFAFLNPSGLNMILVFCYAPLIAFTIDKIGMFTQHIYLPRLIPKTEFLQQHYQHFKRSFRRLSSFNGLFLIIIILLTSAFAIYNWPIDTGDMGFSLSGRPIDQSVIQPSVYHASSWINAQRVQGGDFRTLWLPLDYETQLATRWLDPGSLTLPLGIGQYTSLSLVQYISYVFSALANNATSQIGSLLAQLNVKYIVVNLVPQSYETGSPRISDTGEGGLPFLYGSPEGYIAILNTQKDLQLVENQTDFLIYQNLEYLPSVTVYSNSFYITPTNSQTVDSSLTEALSNLQDFKPSNQVLIFGDDLSQVTQTSFIENSAVVITYMENSNSTPTAVIAISQSGFYRMIFSAVGNNSSSLSFTLNDTEVKSTAIGNGWWESDPIYLSVGTFQFKINTNLSPNVSALTTQENIISSNYLITYRSPSNLTLQEFFNNQENLSPVYTFSKISETAYSVTVDLKGSALIYLGEMYDPGWNAYLANGEKLEHFAADNFGNGFYVNGTGEVKISIKYDPQTTKNAIIFISAVSWVILLLGLTYSYKTHALNKVRKLLSAKALQS